MVYTAEVTTGISYGSFSPLADFEQDLSALGFPDLMAAFIADDLKSLGERCQSFDEHLREYLRQNSVAMNAFDNVEELRAHLERA